MNIQFLGAANEVTGSCTLVEANSKRILVDCGFFQGEKKDRLKNYSPFPFGPSSIDYVFLTHAHADHVGRLPRLVKDGLSGKIFATEPTIHLLKVMLLDALSHLKEEARELSLQCLYEKSDIMRALNLTAPFSYGRKIRLDRDISVRFSNAGHILGSAIIEFLLKESGRERTLIFSGDLGSSPSPLLSPPYQPRHADIVVMEGTYGNRNHEDLSKRKDILEDIIEEVTAKRGVLIIPAFALERMHVLLYEIQTLIDQKKIPFIPVFLDSPLGQDILPLYRKYRMYLNRDLLGTTRDIDRIFHFPSVTFVRTSHQSKALDRIAPPKIIIAASGMSMSGRILHHEKLYLPDSRNTILFVNYQAKGTRGAQIFEGAKVIEIFGQRVPIRATRRSISGYSAHADARQLHEWIMNIQKPIQKIFLMHGERSPLREFQVWIQDNTGIETVIPSFGEALELF